MTYRPWGFGFWEIFLILFVVVVVFLFQLNCLVSVTSENGKKASIFLCDVWTMSKEWTPEVKVILMTWAWWEWGRLYGENLIHGTPSCCRFLPCSLGRSVCFFPFVRHTSRNAVMVGKVRGPNGLYNAYSLMTSQLLWHHSIINHNDADVSEIPCCHSCESTHTLQKAWRL